MKRLITSLLLSAATIGTANAHTLAGDSGHLAQLDHQLLGAHHLPLTLLLIVLASGAIRLSRRRRQGAPGDGG